MKSIAATKMIPCRGVAEREEINVAATLLASWKPFVKVNRKARSMVNQAIQIICMFPLVNDSGSRYFMLAFPVGNGLREFQEHLSRYSRVTFPELMFFGEMKQA